MGILVTGGAGFIGSNLAQRLQDVVVVDNLSEGHHDNVPLSATFVQQDLRDADALESLFKAHRFDTVYHLAAHFANQKSVENPQMDLEVNGQVTLRLLQLAQKFGVRKFVYSSSSCIYGAVDSAMAESLIPRPETPYGITKLLGEYYVQYFHDYYGMDTTVVRYFNVYGPGEYPGTYRNVVPKFFHASMHGQPLVITGTGEETRDFTYVDDAVDATLWVSEKTNGQVFNIGNGQSTSIKTLAEHINAVTHNPAAVQFTSRRDWDHISHRKADVTRLNASGFKSRIPLHEGLQKTHVWLRKVMT